MIDFSGSTMLKHEVIICVLPRSKKPIMNFTWYKETYTRWCYNATIQLVSTKFSNVSPRGEKVPVKGWCNNLNINHSILRSDQELWFSSWKHNFSLNKKEKNLYSSFPGRATPKLASILSQLICSVCLYVLQHGSGQPARKRLWSSAAQGAYLSLYPERQHLPLFTLSVLVNVIPADRIITQNRSSHLQSWTPFHSISCLPTVLRLKGQ